jgi:hypothetical protein
MDPQEVDTIIRHLAAAIAHQETISADLRTCLQEQREFNRQQVAINTDVQTTLARIETLMTRMFPPGESRKHYPFSKL